MAIDRALSSQSENISDTDYINMRMSEMKTEYQSFEGHYTELSEFLAPRRGRFFIQDRNKGEKRHKNIINNRATRALDTAVAGLLAGAMSPSRPWINFTTMNKDVADDEKSKRWLELFVRVLLLVFNKSNFYNMAPIMLKEILTFGTGCMTHVDDFNDVARFYTHTAGSYTIALNSKLNVDTLAFTYQRTAYQLIQQFGRENVSVQVMNNFDRGNYGAWHTVNQFIELNPFRDESRARLNSEFLPFRSVHFEAGNNKGKVRDGKFLSKKGFKGFPAYVPRWETTGEDVYGTNCPGMSALGDIKQLQTQERELAKAIAKAGTPPLQAPPGLKNQPIVNLPGGVTTNTSSNTKIESLYNVDPRVQEQKMSIQDTESRIEQTFFNQLFLAITDMEGIQPKNQLQLSQINEERLLQVGPVLEQIHGEWLDRMVRRTSMQILEAGIMPLAPPKLRGMELELEFVSNLALAQRSAATGGIERTINFASGLISAGWDVSDKINADKALGDYATLVGSPAAIIVPDDEANEARTLKAEQATRAQQLQQGAQITDMLKTASEANLDTSNVLSQGTGGPR